VCLLLPNLLFALLSHVRAALLPVDGLNCSAVSIFDVCGHCFFVVAFSPSPFIFCSYSRCNETRSKAVVVPTRVRMSGPWSVCRHVSREEERMDAYSLLPLLFCVSQIFVIANLCALSRERGKGKEERPCTNKLRVCSMLWRGVEEVWGMMNEQEKDKKRQKTKERVEEGKSG